MPTGIYPRTKNQLKAAKKNLALGHAPEAREKARKKLIEKGKNPEWRKLVSEKTKEAMHKPVIRKKHLKGLIKAREKYGINFKGGKGQEPTPIIKLADKLFSRCGFIKEFAINTKPVQHLFENIRSQYNVDFGNPERKVAIEMDGICHRTKKRKQLDKKKTKVIKALGWKIFRLQHKGI